MNWHKEVLRPQQRRALLSLGRFAQAAGFYLGGGTAIALRLGHRFSQDFDWFTPNKFDEPIRLAEDLGAGGVAFVGDEAAPRTLYGRVHGTRVSFFQYPYRLLRKPQSWRDFGCRVAHLDDLAAMKLLALGQRGSKKDFVDLYVLCQEHGPLHRLMKMYERKYRVRADRHLVSSLVYFQDADREAMPAMRRKVRWPEIKDAFREWAKQLAK
jgi:predicted nucleotidyltransferase component of viral defense system